jgi:hypothetical protein
LAILAKISTEPEKRGFPASLFSVVAEPEHGGTTPC